MTHHHATGVFCYEPHAPCRAHESCDESCHAYWWVMSHMLTWFINMCDMTDQYVRHDSYVMYQKSLHVRRLVNMRDTTRPYVWHDSPTCVKGLVLICDMTQMCRKVPACHACWRVMGWLRWVGCLKIQVSLENTGLFCRALLQKRPIFLSILLIVATPYDISWPVRIKSMSSYDITGHDPVVPEEDKIYVLLWGGYG